MILEPPEGFAISFAMKKGSYGDYSRPPSYAPLRRAAVVSFSKAFRAIGSPRMLPVLGHSDLVHVDGCVIPVTRRPWIVGSIEHASNFFSFYDDWQNTPSMRKRLLRSLQIERCKKILCLSDAAAETLKLGLGDGYESIENKVDVLYPAVPSNCLARATGREGREGSIRVLFVGSHFFDKGGREVLRAFSRIRKNHDVVLDLVTGAPTKHRDQFEKIKSRFKDDTDVRFHSMVPRSVLWGELYANADIFCFPSYMETFGYVILEAMANELAVVATNQFALPEMVKHEETGLLVEPPIASFERGVLRTRTGLARYQNSVMQEEMFTKLVDALEITITRLVKDEPLRRRLARAGFESVEKGCFSVKHRNKSLADTYREALGIR